jgi:HK97 family phage prohead protease
MRKATPMDDSIRRMTVPFEVKSVSASTDGQFAGEIEGYAAGILNIDRAGDMILPGAFADTISDFLKEGVICWQHDWATPIGKPIEAREDAYGLFSKARISKTQAGTDCMTLIRDGVVNKLSIGYRVKDYQWVDRAGLLAYLSGSGLSSAKQADILRQYDEADLDELFLLKKIKLYEYSPVTIPANPNATITGAKSLLAGLSFNDQLLTALAAVQEVKARAEQIKSLREQDGRTLSAERRKSLEDIAGELEGLPALVREVVRQTVEEKQAEEPAVEFNPVHLFAEFQLLEARSLRAA